MVHAWDDPRAKWMGDYILKTTKAKPDKWEKLVHDEEVRFVAACSVAPNSRSHLRAPNSECT